MKKWWPVFLLFILAITLAVIGFSFLHKSQSDTNKMQETLENIGTSDLDDTDSTMDDTAANQDDEQQDNATVDEEPVIPYENPYLSYFEENSDMVGWLQVPDTPIDYPVMQTMEDENYYLLRGFDKQSNVNGCLIMDTDSDVATPGTNLIIHGHNMNSGAMFGTLKYYEDETYCKEHSTIYFYTEEEKRTYEVIAVFRSQVFKKTDTVFKYYQFFEAANEAEFNNFYDNIKEMSLYDTGNTAEYGDNFITLSTCAYHVTYGRFVVVAKQVPNQE